MNLKSLFSGAGLALALVSVPGVAGAHLCHSYCVRSGAVCHSHGSSPTCFTNSCTCAADTMTEEEFEKQHPEYTPEKPKDESAPVPDTSPEDPKPTTP